MYDGPSKPTPPPTDDWRWLELLEYDPKLVMDELLTLSEAILDTRVDYQEASSELRLAEERLKRMEAQVVQAAWDEKSEAVQGSNSEIRSRKELLFLADHPSVLPLRQEVEEARQREADARLAMETLMDRQKNLHGWARMFEGLARVLATVKTESVWSEEKLAVLLTSGAARLTANEEEVDAAVARYAGTKVGNEITL